MAPPISVKPYLKRLKVNRCRINDLGITVNSAFTPAANALANANKAVIIIMLYFIKRSFTCLKSENFVPLYSASVRPHMPSKKIVHTPKRHKPPRKMTKVSNKASLMKNALKSLNFSP